MGFWGNMFNRRSQVPAEPVAKIAQNVERLIDTLANDLFRMYHETLLRESIVYIVFAVWGAKKDGPLTETQKEIHTYVSPVINEIRDIFSLDYVTPQQDYAIHYLVRSLLISKITFMIEHLKLRLAYQSGTMDDALSHSSPPDVLTDEWLSNLSITKSESWRRKFKGNSTER